MAIHCFILISINMNVKRYTFDPSMKGRELQYNPKGDNSSINL